MSKEYILITGASGFVGSQAVDYFLNKPDMEIIATDINYPLYSLLKKWVGFKNFKFIQLDLRDRSQMTKLLEEYLEEKLIKLPPEYSPEECAENSKCRLTVLHIGGIFDYLVPEKLLFDVNVGGTQNLFEALKPVANKINRVVIWGAGAVYGNFDFELPATERSPINPQNAYSRSKLEQERMALNLGKYLNIPVTVMRLGAIYGPRSRYGMGACIKLYADGQLSCFIFGSGKNRVALVHVLDTVRAAWFLSKTKEAICNIYNVVDDFSYTMMEMATFLGRELNSPVYKHFHLPKSVFNLVIKNFDRAIKNLKVKPAIDPESANLLKLDVYISNAKLRGLGFEFRYTNSFDGLKETIEWYRREEWI